MKISIDILEKINDWLRTSDALVITSGAGMSADSGISTYRGEDGTWGRLEKEFNKGVTEIMTPQFIQEHPVFMWKRFSKGQARGRQIKPHRGYQILLHWIQRFQLDYFTVTSNVDGLFRKAGFEENNIYEVHGAGGFLQCTVPCWDQVWQSDYAVYHFVKELKEDNLPLCPNCGSLVRPNVLIFKDRTFVPTRIRAQRQRFEQFLSKYQEKSILVIEIGSGPTIKTIRNITRKLLRDYQVRAIRINPYEPEIEPPHISIAQGALDALLVLDRYTQEQ